MKWHNVLFDEHEGVCTGDAYATKVNSDRNFGEFFSINPLDVSKDHGYFLKDKYDEHTSRRADINVSQFRNFMFEMDCVPVEDQIKIFNGCGLPWATMTFSGGKSVHAILSVEGGLKANCHEVSGLDDYALAWKRLAAKIDRAATRLGFQYPEGASSFLDSSTRNPSRFSRTPGHVRDNGKKQKLLHLGSRISGEEFETILESCPEVGIRIRTEFDAPEDEVDNIKDFMAIMPRSLKMQLLFPEWASRDGNYEHLFRLTCWAVDATNVSERVFIEFLNKYTFGTLVGIGYPVYKLNIGVDHAFRHKNKK